MSLVLIPPFEWEWLRNLPYKQYVQTVHWQNCRNEALRLADFTCQKCGEKGDLHVHHLTYEHRGSEQEYPEDLQVLCKSCHQDAHGIRRNERRTA